MEKRWSKAEITHLERHAASANLEELAQKFHTDADTVRRKIEELGLGASSAAGKVDEEALKRYSKGLELLYAKKWDAAADEFQGALELSDTRQLSDRARQNLEICRRATAADDGADDPYLAAVYEKNRGNLESALDLCQNGSRTEQDERWAYLAASIQALAGAEEEALRLLETAIRLEPRNRIHAYHDPDFSELRGHESFTELLGDPTSS